MTYLGSILHDAISSEPMAFKTLKKISSEQTFCAEKKILTPALQILLCNVLIYPHFDHVCAAW